LTFVTAAIGSLQYCTFKGQLDVMQGQLDAMEADQRPWIYLPGTEIASPLHIDAKGAFVVLQFHPTNVGKTPGKFAFIEGSFFALSPDGREILKSWKPCNDLRNQSRSSLNHGGTLFPNENRVLIHGFTLIPEEIVRVRDGKAGSVMITGCIDYLFESGERHHQTRFIYELDRPTPGRPFAPIKFELGDIPAAELVLGVNPNVANDAD
jgi:hypothetical protein